MHYGREVPEVVRTLATFGFRQGELHSLLVIITACQRQQQQHQCFQSFLLRTYAHGRQWVVDPNKKWLIGNGNAMFVKVTMRRQHRPKTLSRARWNLLQPRCRLIRAVLRTPRGTLAP